jgi:CheY-like chemotaxis protein
MSILLVEDDAVVRTSLCFALESSHIQVVEAGSVAEGRERFQPGITDVVVLDVHLPDGTGHDLAQWLRRLQPRLPLVMISTDHDAPDRQPRLPAAFGRIALLSKPFSASQLLDAISSVAAEGDAP